MTKSIWQKCVTECYAITEKHEWDIHTSATEMTTIDNEWEKSEFNG